MAQKETPREVLTQLLAVRYPGIRLEATKEVISGKGGIWTSAKDGVQAKDGFPLFNCDAEEYQRYDRRRFGTHTELVEWLEQHGWYAEWYSGDKVILWAA